MVVAIWDPGLYNILQYDSSLGNETRIYQKKKKKQTKKHYTITKLREAA